MRLDMELEFDKYCVIDGSPTTVLPFQIRQHSKKPEKKRRSKGYSRYSNDVFSLKEEAIARSFNRYRSASCKTTSSLRKVSTESKDEPRKRGSVYQSSKEVRLMQRTDFTQERRKIELSSSNNSDNNTPLSYGIVESLCSSDEDEDNNIQEEERRDSVMSLRSDVESNPVSDRIKQICVDSDMGGDKSRDSVMSFRSDLSRATTSKSHIELNPVSDKIKCTYRTTKVENEQITDMDDTYKSLSAKLTIPHSPACSETDSSKATSPKGRFGQVRRVLDPFVKPKPVSSSSEQHIETTPPSKMKTLRKSLLHDFSNIGHPWQTSPAHLQGLLKMVQKHGVLPYFEFSVKVPEEVYIAKIWKPENSVDWIYTFHSTHDGRKSNASGKGGSKDGSKLSSIVGQMHVSCFLRTKPNGYGVSDNSMVSEFILYNVANSRRSVEDSSRVFAKNPKVHDENEINVKGQQQQQQQQEGGRSRNSTRGGDDAASSPLAHTELLTHLQAAAIVVQVPFEGGGCFADCTTTAKVNVVMPCGVHSLPTDTTEESRQRPSPLLDRWRIGGGCDCGGWDLACPLNVLGNPTVQIISREDDVTENCQPLDLFIQGKKDNTPALSIRKTEEEGHYAVDFHAQLSTLQAFSVSMAVLHATEPSLGFAHEQKTRLLQRNVSLEAFTNAEKVEKKTPTDTTKKTKVSKNIRKGMQSFMVKPPFSPIARV